MVAGVEQVGPVGGGVATAGLDGAEPHPRVVGEVAEALAAVIPRVRRGVDPGPHHPVRRLDHLQVVDGRAPQVGSAEPGFVQVEQAAAPPVPPGAIDTPLGGGEQLAHRQRPRRGRVACDRLTDRALRLVFEAFVWVKDQAPRAAGLDGHLAAERHAFGAGPPQVGAVTVVELHDPVSPRDVLAQLVDHPLRLVAAAVGDDERHDGFRWMSAAAAMSKSIHAKAGPPDSHAKCGPSISAICTSRTPITGAGVIVKR